MTTTIVKFDPESPPISPYRCQPVNVKALDGLRIWIEYADGASGELDFSHLKGKGVFKRWDDRAFFEGVHVNEVGDVSWGFYDDSEMEMDFNRITLYHRLTGIPLKTLMPRYPVSEE